VDALAHRQLPAFGQARLAGGAAAGLGLVEQRVDLLQLLEHGGAVLRELRCSDVEAGSEGRGEERRLHGAAIPLAFRTRSRSRSVRSRRLAFGNADDPARRFGLTDG
jgi:hypothetical protein